LLGREIDYQFKAETVVHFKTLELAVDVFSRT